MTITGREAAFPCLGEINYTVYAKAAMQRVEEITPPTPRQSGTDGISLEFADWRLNLRSSNTEPLLRLNVESRGNAALIFDRVRNIESVIGVKR